MAPTPLLATKLFVPPLRGDAVARTRLVDRLESGLRQRLTLVAAPAGFGKSTLVATWAARTRVPVAWLSLDEEDAAPLRFLAYLHRGAAAGRAGPGRAGRCAPCMRRSRLRRPRPPRRSSTRWPPATDPIALVLDDYHLVDVDGHP